MGLVIGFCLLIFVGLAGQIKASVTINEIYPAPPQNESEWVELYNGSDVDVDLKSLHAEDEKHNNIVLPEQILKPNEYAIATSTAVLNNTGGDSVYLFTAQNEIVDSVSYRADFQAGMSYVKCINENEPIWISTKILTIKEINTQACYEPSPTPTTIPTPNPSNTPTRTLTPTTIPTNTPTPYVKSYDKIYINEAMTDPPSEESEWIELYNDNEYSVDLMGWQFDDIESGGSKPKTFSITIERKSYVVVDIANPMFNNSGDDIRLLDPTGKTIDKISYKDSVENKTWNRKSYGTLEMCLLEKSPKAANPPCLANTPPTSITSVASPTPSIQINQEIELKYNKESIPDVVKTASISGIISFPHWYFQTASDSTTIRRLPTIATPSGEILGVTDEKKPFPLFSVTSAASSILTIATVLYKMKQNAQ